MALCRCTDPPESFLNVNVESTIFNTRLLIFHNDMWALSQHRNAAIIISYINEGYKFFYVIFMKKTHKNKTKTKKQHNNEYILKTGDSM